MLRDRFYYAYRVTYPCGGPPMFLDSVVPVPDQKITRKHIRGTTYIYYLTGTKRDPSTGKPKPDWKAIGRQLPDRSNKMNPNQNYLLYFPEEELPEIRENAFHSGCQKVGAWLVIRKVIKDYGLDSLMRTIIGKDSGLFLDLAAYSIITEGNAAQYYPDYAYNHPLFTSDMKIFSDSKISDFLKSITDDQRLMFLEDWNEERNHRQNIYISYDSTNKHSDAGDVDLVEAGHPKVDTGKTIFNYSIAYDQNNAEPLLYESYMGSIVDVAELQRMVEKVEGYGYRNIGFVLDRGYFSKEHIRYMDSKGFNFVIMVKGTKDLVSSIVREKSGTFENSRRYFIREYEVYGITVNRRLYPTDARDRHFHIYYSPYKCAAERAELNRRVNKMLDWCKERQGKAVKAPEDFRRYLKLCYRNDFLSPEKKAEVKPEDNIFMGGEEDHDAIDAELQLCGYFVIITSANMTAQEALITYNSRDASENLFRADKSYLGNSVESVHFSDSTEAEIFIEFVALIIRNRIFTLLRKAMAEQHQKLNTLTVPAAIRELEKIEMIRQPTNIYILDRAATKTQKKILTACGINTNDYKDDIKELSHTLMKMNDGYSKEDRDQ